MESRYKSLLENAKLTKKTNDQWNDATNPSLKMENSPKTELINGIMLQISP